MAQIRERFSEAVSWKELSGRWLWSLGQEREENHTGTQHKGLFYWHRSVLQDKITIKHFNICEPLHVGRSTTSWQTTLKEPLNVFHFNKCIIAISKCYDVASWMSVHPYISGTCQTESNWCGAESGCLSAFEHFPLEMWCTRGGLYCTVCCVVGSGDFSGTSGWCVEDFLFSSRACAFFLFSISEPMG